MQTSREPLAHTTTHLHIDRWTHRDYAEIDIALSNRGGHARRRLAAARELAHLYRVSTRRILDGCAAYHPDRLTAVGEPADVARFAAALPHALAAMEAAATDYSRRIGAWARNTSAGDYAAAGAGSLAALQRACRREFLAHLARALCLSPERTLVDPDASPDDTLDAAHATAAELRPNIDNWTDQKAVQRLLARASCRSDAAAAAAETNRVPLRVPLPAPVEAPVTQRTVPVQASLFDIAA